MSLRTVRTSSLELAFYDHGPPTGWPVVLSHGFPYDIHAYDDVIPILVARGARVLVPYLRGFGPTRFLSSSVPRTGQQAALGKDIVELLDATHIDRAILAGFDWGGLASCVASLLWPQRVSGLVSYAGYDVMDLAAAQLPADPALECVMWYQHLFQHERGRRCLEQSRRALCHKLWQQWSPTWDPASMERKFQQTAPSFDNPDFVDVVIHCYQYVLSTAKGDPQLQTLEDKLALKPPITVPTITLDGTQDPLKPGGSSSHAPMFSGFHERREYPVGHAFPLEDPAAFADAIIKLHVRDVSDRQRVEG